MKKLTIALLAAGALLPMGCASYSPVTKGLGQDGAIVRADINSPWGKQTLVLIRMTTNQVRVTGDGEIIVNGR